MQRLILSFAIASAIAAPTIYAQQPSPSPAASPSPTATASPAKPAAPSPAPVPLAEAAWQSEAVLARLQDMVARPDPTVGEINRQLGPFAYEISSRLTENSQIVAASPPTEQLARSQSMPLWSKKTWRRSALTDGEWARRR